METFRIPMREVRKRFRKSELVMLGWRSAEMGHNMSSTRNESHRGRPITDTSDYTGVPPVHTDHEIQTLEDRMGPKVVQIINQTGDVDLRKLTGAEAMQFMAAMGINVGGRTTV